MGEKKKDFFDPNYYSNRELSWLLFNHRVLGEARDKSNLLFERLKFLSITASNLDEFFMVRVADLKRHQKVNPFLKDISGLTVEEQLDKISKRIHELYKIQYEFRKKDIVALLLVHAFPNDSPVLERCQSHLLPPSASSLHKISNR